MKPTHLTPDAIMQIYENKDDIQIKSNLIVQVINSESKSDKALEIFVSDGTTSMGLFLIPPGFNSFKEVFPNRCEPHRPIICITTFGSRKRDNSNVLKYVKELYVIDAGLTEVIGEPMSVEDYLKCGRKNLRGDNRITYKVDQATKKQVTQQPLPSIKITAKPSTTQTQTKSEVKTVTKPPLQISNTKSTQPIMRVENVHSSGMKYTPIHSLYPTMNNWCVKARVVSKSDKRSFVNKSKNVPGELFTIEIVDSFQTQIQGTFFNEACRKYYDHIQVGKVYEFSKGIIKQQRYSNNQEQRYQINFEEYSVMPEVEDTQDIKGLSYKLVKIKDIDNLPVQTFVDVLGMLRELGKVSKQNLKSGEVKSKLTFSVCDDTAKIQVTLWGSSADSFKAAQDQMIFLKGLKVSEYNGTRQLSGSGLTTSISDHKSLKEEIQEFDELAKWFEENKDKIIEYGENTNMGSSGISRPLKTLEEVEKNGNQNLNNRDYKEFSDVRCFILAANTKGTAFYHACPKCQKKVNQLYTEQKYSCSSCQDDDVQATPRYIMSFRIADSTCGLWVTLNHNCAEQALQTPCEEYVKMGPALHQELNGRAFPVEKRLLIRSSVDNYNNQSRVRYQVVKILDDDFCKETEELLKQIETLRLL